MTLRSGYLRIPVAILVLPLAFTGLAEAQQYTSRVHGLDPGLTHELAATPAPGTQPEHYGLESFLGEKLWVWQKRLNLTSWDIRVKLARSSELKPKTLGNIHWDADTHTAEIHVLAPEDYKLSTRDMLADMEFTVVHELVHLQLSSLPRSEASRGAEEHAVNQITQALLNLDRR
jgi:hypothetical protein